MNFTGVGQKIRFVFDNFVCLFLELASLLVVVLSCLEAQLFQKLSICWLLTTNQKG